MTKAVGAAAGLVLVLAVLGSPGLTGLVPGTWVQQVVGHAIDRDVPAVLDDVEMLVTDLVERGREGLQADTPASTCDGTYATAADVPVDLDLHERLGGHTLDRHVGRSDDWLRQRLERSPRLGAASSFEDQASAEHFIGQVITCRRAAIAGWLSRDSRTETLMVDISQVTGRSMVRDADRSVLVDGVSVVLRRHPSAPGGVMILTAYPDGGR